MRRTILLFCVFLFTSSLFSVSAVPPDFVITTFITPNLDYTLARVMYTYSGTGTRTYTLEVIETGGVINGSTTITVTPGTVTSPVEITMNPGLISPCETLTLRVSNATELYTATTFARPCFGTVPGTNPLPGDPTADGRINTTLSFAVYTQTTATGCGIRFYGLNANGLVTSISYIGADELADLPDQPQENLLILRAGDGTTLYKLTTGEYQINSAPDIEGKVHVVIWSGCPAQNIYETSFNVFRP
jgi:hypothetical protein